MIVVRAASCSCLAGLIGVHYTRRVLPDLPALILVINEAQDRPTSSSPCNAEQLASHLRSHQQVITASRVGGDQGIDLLDCVPQLVVGICRRQLELCDEPVHLPSHKLPSEQTEDTCGCNEDIQAVTTQHWLPIL